MQAFQQASPVKKKESSAWVVRFGVQRRLWPPNREPLNFGSDKTIPKPGHNENKQIHANADQGLRCFSKEHFTKPKTP
jgi:hypothetical protein